MVFKSFRDRQGRILVGPKNKSDEALFIHCANGSNAVTTRIFNSEVKDMLFIHGVSTIEIAEENK